MTVAYRYAFVGICVFFFCLSDDRLVTFHHLATVFFLTLNVIDHFKILLTK